MSVKRVKNVLVASMILCAAAFPDKGRAHAPAPPRPVLAQVHKTVR